MESAESVKEKNRLRAKLWHANNRDKRLAYFKQRYDEARQKVFEHFNNKCICCGESETSFLSIDHVNNDGNKFRGIKNGSLQNSIYPWLVKNNFPDGYQLLCMNCNVSKHRNNGVCAHQAKSLL